MAETVTSLSRLDRIPATMRMVSRMPVSQARNTLAKMALEAPNVAGFVPMGGWYVLWVDADAFWRHGTVEHALRTLVTHREKIDILAGWFGPRAENSGPAVRFEDGSWPRPGTNCEYGDLVEVHRCGFHFVMHSLDVLTRVGPDPFALEDGDEAEDFAFCRRAREAGLRIWTQPGLNVAHIGDDGTAYLPGESAYTVLNGELVKVEQPQVRSYGPDVDRASRLQISEALIHGA